MSKETSSDEFPLFPPVNHEIRTPAYFKSRLFFLEWVVLPLITGLPAFITNLFFFSLNILFVFISLSCLIFSWFVKVKHNLSESDFLIRLSDIWREKQEKESTAFFQDECSLVFICCYLIWQKLAVKVILAKRSLTVNGWSSHDSSKPECYDCPW